MARLTESQILAEQEKKVKTMEERLRRVEAYSVILQRQIEALNRKVNASLEKLSAIDETVRRLKS